MNLLIGVLSTSLLTSAMSASVDFEPPHISGVNSAIVKVSQTISLAQLVNSFLVISDNRDTIPLSHIRILNHSTCNLDLPQVGTCSVFLQAFDYSGNESLIFPLELTFVPDTKPQLTAPNQLFLSSRMALTHEFLDSLFTYDRENHYVEQVENTMTNPQKIEGEHTLTYRISDENGNRYYVNIEVDVMTELPEVIVSRTSSIWSVFVPPDLVIKPSDYTTLASLMNIEEVGLIDQLSTYRVNPTQQTTNVFDMLDFNQQSITIHWQVDDSFATLVEDDNTWWSGVWQWVNAVWDWVVEQFNQFVNWVSELFKSM